MKNTLLFMLFCLSLNISAQTPQGFNFQAVLRSKNGELMKNKSINLKISITADTVGVTTLYSEAHTKQTSATGAVSIIVGRGFALTNTFAAIDWTKGNRYLKVEFAETGQTQFDLFSITQLLSVPFALRAQTVEKEIDPQFALSVAAGIKATDTVRWNAKSSFSGKYTDLASLPTFAKIATTGSYADLTNKPLFTSYDSHLANTVVHITTTERTNWNAAFTWGDHSKVGYLKSYTETDPLFSSSLAAGLKATDTAKWNAKSTFSGEYSDLSGIPTLAKVASSGSYNDLGNKLTAGAGIAINASNVISTSLVGLPTQTGNAGKVLTTNGTAANWVDVNMGNPTGTVIYFAAATPPSGYLICDGSAISRTTYAALFAILGTTFGAGDGSTTFNLPDLRGEFIRGWDNSRGIDVNRVLGTGQTDLIKEHNLSLQPIGGSDPGAAMPVAYFSAGNTTWGYGQTTAIICQGNIETRPRNIALLACIKY